MPGPMDGYKIVDFSQVVSGPFATMLLADQGADVTKVEPLYGPGDVTRLLAYAKGGMSAFYLNNNRGKRSIGLDLGSDEGRHIALDLCKEADVVVQNFRPGAMTRLGLDYDAVKVVNPNVIYCTISGFGPTGPYSDRPVLDPVIQGLTGIISRQMNPEIPFPDLVRNLYADKSSALTAAQAITAALLVRERSGEGQYVEIPMLDACMYFFWPDGMMDQTVIDDDASPGFLLSSIYSLTECSDGKIVYFVTSDPMRQALYDALGRPEWKEDVRFATMMAISNPENFQTLGVLLAEAFSTLTIEEALDALIANDVPCGPILSAEEAIADPQVVHNETLQVWQHPQAGSVRQPRPAARFEKTPASIAATASLRGADNDAILAELGRSSDDIAALRHAGIIE
ncbi:MAG: crotonobetainyl-CoA:carnitine CoA-transferase CaiB-like acyl-CoA transferase [Acidimicrobiales bacterium]|jgi:crotonobetainyl-CoA:carnitine CoA-transferase CaiB-like acyl-CoA transferase